MKVTTQVLKTLTQLLLLARCLARLQMEEDKLVIKYYLE